MSTHEVRHKHFESKLQIKALSDTGEFEGYASAFTIDQDGERIARGAFLRTLQHSGGGKVPILFGHAVNDPCGWNVEAKETDTGLWVRGKLATETEIGKKAYWFLRGASDVGSPKGGGLSIGFRVIKDHYETLDKDDPQSGLKKGASIRVFDEISLMEYSVVVFPCNLQAYVTAVKSQYDNAAQKQLSPSGEANEDDMILDAIAGEQDDAYIANVIRAKAKKRTASVDGEEHPAEDFAYVPDPDKPSTWKFPIFDEKHARLAWDLFSKADIPEADKPKVLKRIKAACKKFGIEINDGDGKGTNPVEQTKMMTNADATSSPDFGTNLAGRQRQREIQMSKYDADDALYDTLSAIHGSTLSDDDKKAAIKNTYHKHADVMGDLHVKAMFPEAGEKSADFLAVIKGNALVGIAAPMSVTNISGFDSAEITKSGKKLSAATKAALVGIHAAHAKAMQQHTEVLKDMFGDDSSATLGDGTEMGAMGDKTPIDAKTASDKSHEAKAGQDPLHSQNQQPADVDDSGIHSFLSELRSKTKSRLEVVK